VAEAVKPLREILAQCADCLDLPWGEYEQKYPDYDKQGPASECIRLAGVVRHTLFARPGGPS
jgi:hypothetical protein